MRNVASQMPDSHGIQRATPRSRARTLRTLSTKIAKATRTTTARKIVCAPKRNAASAGRSTQNVRASPQGKRPASNWRTAVTKDTKVTMAAIAMERMFARAAEREDARSSPNRPGGTNAKKRKAHVETDASKEASVCVARGESPHSPESERCPAERVQRKNREGTKEWGPAMP